MPSGKSVLVFATIVKEGSTVKGVVSKQGSLKLSPAWAFGKFTISSLVTVAAALKITTSYLPEAAFDRKGRLSIRGRIKTMILGSSGENIYPEEIESIINNFRFVNESLVVESKGKLVAMVHFNMEELEKQVQKIKSQAGNYKTAINDYIEEQKKELFEYVNSRVNNFSKLQLVLVQHEPFEKTPTHKIKRFLYNNINIK